MSRIEEVFAKLQAGGRKALIPYVTAGDPYPDATVDIMLAMARAGADVIELGVPFSDPMADGPVIQRAAERALAKGIGMPQVLAYVRAFRDKDAATPPTRSSATASSDSSPMPRRPAWTACWWSTIRPRNARASPRRCAKPASIPSSCWRPRPPSSA
jgi:hypothetical protein